MRPRALDGGPLIGGEVGRYIYIDEAGTARQEPVVVVAAAIIKPDHEWRRIAAYLDYLRFVHVNGDDWENYIFHAKDLFSGGRVLNAEGWSLSKRLLIMRRILRIPRKFRVPIAYGYVLKRHTPKLDNRQAHHVAFAMCINEANSFLKLNYPGETGTLIAENVEEMKSRLEGIPAALRSGAIPISLTRHIFDAIVDDIHFTSKQGAPLLQIADHCAFSLRRFIAGFELGETLMRYMEPNIPLEKMNRDGRHNSGGSRGVIQAYSDDSVLLPGATFEGGQ
jgi:hypothetical protein